MNVKILLLSMALVAVAVLLLIHSVELYRLKRIVREFKNDGVN